MVYIKANEMMYSVEVTHMHPGGYPENCDKGPRFRKTCFRDEVVATIMVIDRVDEYAKNW